MKCTLLQYVLLTDEEELLFRRDVRLEVVPSLHDDVYIPAVAVDGSLPIALGVRRCPHSRPSVLEDRVVIVLERMTHADKEQGPTECRTKEGWQGWLAYYGFYETEQGDPLFMTEWSDKQQHVVSLPDHPSPCCGAESGHTGQIGTAFIFTCGLCGQKWHYAGGRAIAGLPLQQEPGVRLGDVFSPLDPTD
jgi:hypothetical protein